MVPVVVSKASFLRLPALILYLKIPDSDSR